MRSKSLEFYLRGVLLRPILRETYEPCHIFRPIQPNGAPGMDDRRTQRIQCYGRRGSAVYRSLARCARVIATATKGLFWLRDHHPGDTLAHGLKRSQRERKASVLRALLPPLREPICACTRIQ